MARRFSAGFFFALFGAAFVWALRAAFAPAPAVGAPRPAWQRDPEAILAASRAARRADELSAAVASALAEHGIGRGDVRFETLVAADPGSGVLFPRTSLGVDVTRDLEPLAAALERVVRRMDRAAASREARGDQVRVSLRLDGVEVVAVELHPMRLPAQEEEGGPRIALVLDDVGYAREPVERLLAQTNRITFAVLPYGTHAKELAELAHADGAEVMLHLPMEPAGAPGGFSKEAMLLDSMEDAELRALLHQALRKVPHAAGVNNHMGSVLTARPRPMRVVMDELAERGLFFLDSRTSPRTIAYRLARERGVPAAERDVFLDDVPDRRAVDAQLARLEALSKKHGSAVAIGHPHPATVEALLAWLPTLEAKGFELVPASRLAGVTAPP